MVHMYIYTLSCPFSSIIVWISNRDLLYRSKYVFFIFLFPSIGYMVREENFLLGKQILSFKRLP